MKAWRAILTGAIVGGTLAGCGSGLGGASGGLATGSAPASRPVSAGSPTAAGGPGAATVLLQGNPQVAFTGDSVALTIQESAGSGKAQQWARLASATVNLGDGSVASASGRCTGVSLPAPSAGLVIRHVYHQTGVVNARVTAVRSCSQQAHADLAGATAALRMLPAAPPASAAWPQCGTSQIDVTATSKGAALGHVGVLFTLQNASSASCRLFGYPGLQMRGSNGEALPTTVVRAVQGAYLLAPVVPHWVALPPGAVGSFDLQYEDVPQGAQANEPYTTACPTAAQLEVTLPNAHDHSVVSAPTPMAPCGGEVLVSPVVPGTQWVAP